MGARRDEVCQVTQAPLFRLWRKTFCPFAPRWTVLSGGGSKIVVSLRRPQVNEEELKTISNLSGANNGTVLLPFVSLKRIM